MRFYCEKNKNETYSVWRFDEENKQFTYKVEGSLFPNWIGQSNLRYYEFSGNRVTYRTPAFLMGGQEIVGVLDVEASRLDGVLLGLDWRIPWRGISVIAAERR